MTRLPVPWIAVLLLVARAAAAQDTYRQTVVVTAAATPVELGTVSRTVTVITRAQIEALPAHSVADLLRLVSTVDVRARGERGVQTDFGVRGAGFGQVLVLVDGVRINDAQSGHHNGDIPVPLAMIERVEILAGAGSSLFGADAFGGTVNVITRRTDAGSSAAVGAGSFGGAELRGTVGLTRAGITEVAGASFERSRGFIAGRDFTAGMVHSRTMLGPATAVSVSFLRKDFGARNFYGASATGDAFSRETTDQALMHADRRFGSVAGWAIAGMTAYRTHGDEFLFTAASAASVHRTHEVLGALTASRATGSGGSVTAGAEGGATWIRSNNLGRHALQRVSGFGEWRQAAGPRTQFDMSLRLDHYSDYGTSWSPAAGASWWAVPRLRVRASAGRAFRVPTFTERYYSDRNHLARPEVGPERSWSGDAGVDLFPGRSWLVQATVFGRADRDVIDWLCADRSCGTPAATERWHTFNVRDVQTTGVELTVRRDVGGGFIQAGYTGVSVDAPAIAQLSKYVLDYAPRTFTAAGLAHVGYGLSFAPRVEVRQRRRSSGSTDYVLLDARLSYRIGRLYQVAVDGTNLLDAKYEEIPGVRMPGTAVMVSLRVGQ